MSLRTEHVVSIMINERRLNRIVIDQHYLTKHADSMNDELILDLVKSIDGGFYDVESEDSLFQYLVAEPVFNMKRPYRLVMVIALYSDYLGIVNAFRINKKRTKYGKKSNISI